MVNEITVTFGILLILSAVVFIVIFEKKYQEKKNSNKIVNRDVIKDDNVSVSRQGVYIRPSGNEKYPTFLDRSYSDINNIKNFLKETVIHVEKTSVNLENYLKTKYPQGRPAKAVTDYDNSVKRLAGYRKVIEKLKEIEPLIDDIIIVMNKLDELRKTKLIGNDFAIQRHSIANILLLIYARIEESKTSTQRGYKTNPEVINIYNYLEDLEDMFNKFNERINK